MTPWVRRWFTVAVVLPPPASRSSSTTPLPNTCTAVSIPSRRRSPAAIGLSAACKTKEVARPTMEKTCTNFFSRRCIPRNVMKPATPRNRKLLASPNLVSATSQRHLLPRRSLSFPSQPLPIFSPPLRGGWGVSLSPSASARASGLKSPSSKSAFLGKKTQIFAYMQKM